jgi:hypothetical protein
MNLGTFVLLKDSADRRGRVYSREDLEKAVIGKTFMGELVPLDGFTDTNLDLARVSHTVNNIRFVGKDLVGDIMTMHTPQGMIVKTLYEEGIRLATSIRAVGRISEDNNVSDLEIFTFDFLMEKAE